MIHLKHILQEISLSGVTPYANSFTWGTAGVPGWEDVVQCDGVSVTFTFSPVMNSKDADAKEYAFSFMTPASDGGDWTVSHERSNSAGQLNYMRLMATSMQAILSFIRTYAPDAIDVVGYDTNSTKAAQKTRIYKSLLDTSSADIAAAGYTVLQERDKLWLVRKSTADTTGTQDKLDTSKIKIKNMEVNGLLVFVPHYGEERMGAFRLRPVQDGYKIKETVLYDRFRNQGIGKGLYRFMIRKLQSQGKRLYSDDYQSADAANVWNALVRDGVAVKLPNGTYASTE
jgi:GNAT superfamily N-acetyltransferase